VFLKGSAGLAESEGFKVKWWRDEEDTRMDRRRGSSFSMGQFLLARRWFWM